MNLVQQTVNIYTAQKFNVSYHDIQHNGVHLKEKI